MKRYVHAFAMCQSMFCAIPCPWKIWDEEAKDKMLLFLPLVGLEIGAIWALLSWLCERFCLPDLVTGLILCACPYILTGFIHLDGFMDVTDAVKSCRDQERRRQILKDPHVGSFGVIGFGLLLLAQFVFLACGTGNHRILIFIPAVSRCCSALAVTGLRPMATSQYAHRSCSRTHLVVLAAQLLACLGAGALLCGWNALALLGCLLGFAVALCRGYRSLGGMNGDISGYALTLGELCALAVYGLI
ncbi:MAG: adenosylcobinamide-GDP ribazoletransferase [Oscillospiraceae bacterium]|nr:adenosylcobinamide-GDP ribazoletransferase [Oscillospiraceae bacterium]